MSSIRDFFRGRVVLLTGATGFLGKALQEKILRETPDIARLYVLVRPGKRPGGGVQSPAERIRREVFETAIFSRLRAAHGDRFWPFVDEKVVAVAGDLTEEGLGVDPVILERLRNEVDVVIHAAASVFFDERIDHAVAMNTLGPKRLVDLARSFPKPPFFAFVSTCYVSGMRRGRIPEEVLPTGQSALQASGVSGAPGLDVAQELAAIDAFTRQAHADCASDTLTQRFRDEASALAAAGELGPGETVESVAAAVGQRWLEKTLVDEGMRRARRLGWHEVYTFTKAMGEQLVLGGRGDLPTALVRPSIIESSFAEPEPGWINGLKVADPLIAGYGKGRIPDFPGRRESIIDLIPVDFVANAILAAVAGLEKNRGLTVYQIASGARNPLRVGEFFDLVRTFYRRHPMRDRRGEPIRAGDWRFPPEWRFRLRYQWGYQAPLAAAARLIAATPWLPWPAGLGKQLARGADAVRRLFYYVNIYAPYTQLDCTYESSNTRQLFEQMDPADQKAFPFDVAAISWPVYVQDIHLSGLDRHVLRFGRSESASTRRRGGTTYDRASTEDLRTLPDLLRLSADRFGDKVALQVKRDGAWDRVTYADFYLRAGRMGALWRSQGLRRGDRVLLLAENMPEWPIAFWAAQAAGATVVPIDIHTPGDEVHEIAAFTEARAILLSPALHAVHVKRLQGHALATWDITRNGLPFAEGGLPMPPLPSPAEVRWEELAPDDIASIIFTSGPAVDPRGCMLTHGNFLTNLLSLSEALRSYETDRFLSVLPLNHALEFTGGLLMPIFSGASVCYAQTLKSKVLLDLAAETGTTAIIGVPRIYEMLIERLRRRGEGASAERSPELVSFVNTIRALVSGGAPLDYSIFEAYAEIGLPIHEGYGLTETAPILTVNSLWAVRARSVGRPLPGVELRIDQPDKNGDGEIVVRGPNIMKGYYRNPAATEKVLRDGYLYTGDIGRVDGDGYVTITGRSKELIVTGAGKNVYPEEVELFYRGIEGVDELAVFGVREPGATRETVHAAVATQADPDKVLEGIHKVSHERPTYQRIQQIHLRTAPLPRTADGERFDRKALREEAIAELRTSKRTRKAAPVDKTTATWWERDTLRILERVAARPSEEGMGRREQLSQIFDSLQLVELLAALEGRFGVTVGEEEAATLRTVGDVLDRVRLAAQDRPEPKDPVDAESVPAAGEYWAGLLAGIEANAPIPKGLVADPGLAPAQALFLGASSVAQRLVFRLSIRGADRLPRDGAFLIAANHQSHLDTFTLLAALRGRVRRVHVLGARDYFFDTPAKAWFFRNFLNVLPFDRDKNFAEGLQACRHLLRPDEPVLIFPEGTRSLNGKLQPFKVGLGILALELGATVVPARLRGTFEAMPKGQRLPRPHRIDVAFGEPVAMAPFRERLGITNRYNLYREIVTEVRQRVERLLDEA